MQAGILELVAGDLAVRLDLASGGRATSWTVSGEELLGGRSDDPVEHGMYPMAPWAGRLDGNTLIDRQASVRFPATYGPWALHGLVLDRPWQLLQFEQSPTEATATITCELAAPWPWPAAVLATWHLTTDALVTTLEVSTQGAAFPAVLGLHPWFRRSTAFGEAAWSLDEPLLAQRDADYRLTGALAPIGDERGCFDDAFLVERGSGAIGWGTGLRIDISTSHPWFVVYDQDPGHVCIEPQTGPPNGINDALQQEVARVTPQRPLVLRTTWRISRDAPGS